MHRGLTPMETGFGVAALIVALAGGFYASNEPVSAQGPTAPGAQGRFGGPGRMGGPGGPGGPGRGGGMAPLGDLMLGRLDLTDAQKEQVKQILDTHKSEQQTLAERGRAAREALDAAITADTFDANTVRARANALGDVEADLAVARAQVRQEVVQILTAEQKAQLKKAQDDMKKRRAEMEKRREERRP